VQFFLSKTCNNNFYLAILKYRMFSLRGLGNLKCFSDISEIIIGKVVNPE